MSRSNAPKAGPRLRLTEARILKGLSQQELAQRIGTTHVNVSRWERGITKPTLYFRRKLCSLFGKSEQELDFEPTLEVKETVSSVPSLSHIPNEALYDPAIPLQPPIPLVGRDAYLAQLKQRLFAGGSIALTALNGLPGVGKTALSMALAHNSEVREHFRDGVLWAGLGPHPNIAGLLSRWGTLLGVSATEMATLNSNQAWARALHTAIGTRRMLLVIDDAWRIEEALMFKVGGPNCAHLVTTRFPGIAAHFAVDGATVIQELSEEESVHLLKLLAPEVVERETQRVTELVQAVGGLPLALTLMGNYLRKQAYSGQSRRITGALKRLSKAEERLQISEPRGPVESHPSLPTDTSLSLQSVITVTDQQLSEQARSTLYALSVFPPKPNSFSEEAALAITACSVDALDTLIDAGLLESAGSDRYTLHQAIADYARMHLKDYTVHDGFISYVISYVEAHKKDYELLELESNIILAALERAYELGKQTELVRGVIGFMPFLLVRGLYSVAQEYLQRAYEAVKTLEDRYSLTSVLLYLGQIALRQGNYARAEAHYQEGLNIAHQIGDAERISALLTDLGTVIWKRGKYMQAETYLQEGLTLARQIGDRERISGLLETLGSIAIRLGNYSKAETYLQEGLKLAHQVEDREQICTMLINLGAAAGEQGNYTRAEAYYQEGLIIARQIGHSEWISLLLSNLGDAAGEQKNYDQAKAYFHEGLELAREIGHREWISLLLLNLGLTARRQGDYIQAEIYFQEGLSLARQIGIPQITCNGLYEHGSLYLDQQKIEAAEATFREMLMTIPEGGQDLLALAQYGLAQVAAIQGNIDEAKRLGEVSAAALEGMGHRKAMEVRHWLESTTGQVETGTEK
jgi:tetratricopeptide (TPR) repeat protein/transcriptional regulator with XRE-family HTH domain